MNDHSEEHYLERAEESRTIAWTMKSLSCRAAWIRIAEGYDSLAAMAAEMELVKDACKTKL